MSRIRWHHFYFVLALFDVFVIMMSLQLHKATLNNAQGVIDAASILDDQSDLIQSTQQRIIQLNAPGNDLFGAKNATEVELLSRQYRIAKSNMKTALDRALAESRFYDPATSATWERDLSHLRSDVDRMIVEADRLFEFFVAGAEPDQTPESIEKKFLRTGPIMARMDRIRHDALATLGLLAQRNAGDRLELLQHYKADLDDRFAYERYVIALVILILVGILAFGRKLQQTDRALAEERRRVQEERRERLAAVGELCSSVAHGIRNPLAAIRSSAQLALELGKMDDESRDRLNDILHEGGRLGDRVTGLLKMARSNSDAFELLNLSDIVSPAVRELKPELARRGICVTEAIQPAPLMIRGDRRHLEQIVIELLSNAMEQVAPNGRIQVDCRDATADGMAMIAVEDDGPGVPDSVKDRIFDLFFTTKPAGTGIGLATVKRIARLHGGDVVVRCGRSGGARFEILLPIAREAVDRLQRRRRTILNAV